MYKVSTSKNMDKKKCSLIEEIIWMIFLPLDENKVMNKNEIQKFKNLISEKNL